MYDGSQSAGGAEEEDLQQRCWDNREFGVRIAIYCISTTVQVLYCIAILASLPLALKGAPPW
jgi:hypothetical protein